MRNFNGKSTFWINFAFKIDPLIFLQVSPTITKVEHRNIPL